MRTFLILAAVFGLSLAQIEFEELNHLVSVQAGQLKNDTFDCVIFINDLVTAEGTHQSDIQPIADAISEYVKVSTGLACDQFTQRFTY